MNFFCGKYIFLAKYLFFYKCIPLCSFVCFEHSFDASEILKILILPSEALFFSPNFFKH